MVFQYLPCFKHTETYYNSLSSNLSHDLNPHPWPPSEVRGQSHGFPDSPRYTSRVRVKGYRQLCLFFTLRISCHRSLIGFSERQEVTNLTEYLNAVTRSRLVNPWASTDSANMQTQMGVVKKSTNEAKLHFWSSCAACSQLCSYFHIANHN